MASRMSSSRRRFCEEDQQVSVGATATFALKTDGSIWAWGFNSGQLGDNTTVDRSSPVQIFNAEKTWKFVSGGYVSAFFIKDYNL